MRTLLLLLLSLAAWAQNPLMTGTPTTVVPSGGRVAWSSLNVIAYDFADYTTALKYGYYDMAISNPNGTGYVCITCPSAPGASALPLLNDGNPIFTPDGKYLIFMMQGNPSLGNLTGDFAGFPGQGYRCDLWATDMKGNFWQLTTQGRWGVQGILTAVSVTPGIDSGLPNSGTFTTTGGGGTGATGTFTASGGNLVSVTLTTGGAGSGYTSNPTMVPNSGTLGTSAVNFIGSGGVIYPTMSHGGTLLAWGQRDVPGVTENDNATPGQWDLAYATFSESGGVPSLGTPTLICGGSLSAAYCSGNLGTQSGYVEPHTFSLDDSTIFFMGNLDAGMNTYARNTYSYNISTGVRYNLTKNYINWTEYPTAIPTVPYGANKIMYMLYPNAGGQPGQNVNCIADYWVMNYDGSDNYQVTFFNTPGSSTYSATQPVCTDDPSFGPTGTQLVMFPNYFAADGHVGVTGPNWILNMSNAGGIVQTSAFVSANVTLSEGYFLQ
jgi:hypothetical protein